MVTLGMGPRLRHGWTGHPDARWFRQGRGARNLRLWTWLSAIERWPEKAARCARVRGPGTVVENLPEAGQIDNERSARCLLGGVGNVGGRHGGFERLELFGL